MYIASGFSIKQILKSTIMKNYQYFIGIDISKNELDFALIESNKVLFHVEVSNDKKGIEQFIKKIKVQYTQFSLVNSLFCMEHTGIYNNVLLNYLHEKKADIWLEQATQIKSSMGVSREKNDKVDSQKIGLYAYKNREDVKLWTPKREIISRLDRLTALRERLVKTIKTLKIPFSDAEGLVEKKNTKV